MVDCTRRFLNYLRRKLLTQSNGEDTLDIIDLKLPDDFYEKLNKNILFTGAGFSKGFGGLLASELEQYIFNNVKSNDDIKSIIAKGSGNYEDNFSLLRENKKIYTEVLESVFKLIDENIRKNNNVYNLKKFLELFYKNDSYNFIFTANQDLLLERYAMFTTDNDFIDENNNHIANEPKLYFPYQDYNLTPIVRNTINRCIQNRGKDYKFEDMTKTVKFESSKFPSNNVINYVKLHGSWNWHHTEGYVINITGVNKSSDMDTTKILKTGRNLFNKVVKTKLNIVVVGYSFGDPHINDILLDAIHNQSRIIIISSESYQKMRERGVNFEKHKNDSDSREVFYASIAKYYQFKFEDFIDGSNFYAANEFGNLKEYLK